MAFRGHGAGQSITYVSIRPYLRATAVHRVVVAVFVRDVETIVGDIGTGTVGQIVAGPPICLDQILSRMSRVCTGDVEIVAHRAQPEAVIERDLRFVAYFLVKDVPRDPRA